MPSASRRSVLSCPGCRPSNSPGVCSAATDLPPPSAPCGEDAAGAWLAGLSRHFAACCSMQQSHKDSLAGSTAQAAQAPYQQEVSPGARPVAAPAVLLMLPAHKRARRRCLASVRLPSTQHGAQASAASAAAPVCSSHPPPAFLHQLPVQLPPALAQAVPVAAAVEAAAGGWRRGRQKGCWLRITTRRGRAKTWPPCCARPTHRELPRERLAGLPAAAASSAASRASRAGCLVAEKRSGTSTARSYRGTSPSCEAVQAGRGGLVEYTAGSRGRRCGAGRPPACDAELRGSPGSSRPPRPVRCRHWGRPARGPAPSRRDGRSESRWRQPAGYSQVGTCRRARPPSPAEPHPASAGSRCRQRGRWADVRERAQAAAAEAAAVVAAWHVPAALTAGGSRM